MTTDLLLVALIPLLPLAILLAIPSRAERSLFQFVFLGNATVLISQQIFAALWLLSGSEPLTYQFSIYHSEAAHLNLTLLYDRNSCVFALLGSFLIFLVANYSRHYLFGEAGYKRFFVVLQIFVVGYFWVILANQLDWLMVGWELVGISSFLLIGFYRERYIPVRNAYKVFSYYRFGDLCLLMMLWLTYQHFPEGLYFSSLSDLQDQGSLFADSRFFLSLLLVVSLLKSAQGPFMGWLPRAMEGPTPSSAIFYGAITIHLGAFLLLRFESLWQGQVWFCSLLFVFGLITAGLASLASRTQANIKGQVAYSSISQLGVIFMELALGFSVLALFHLVGNALLRTFQLLASPSAVSYLLREQSHEGLRGSKPSRLAQTQWGRRLYWLSVLEYQIDLRLEMWIWLPLKKLGSHFSQWPRWSAGSLPLLLIIPLVAVVCLQSASAAPYVFALIAALFLFVAFAWRGDARLAWIFLLLNCVLILVSVSMQSPLSQQECLLYFTGVGFGGVGGWMALQQVRQMYGSFSLGSHYGAARNQSWAALLFLLSGLMVAGFPISPTFLGEDILFHHIRANDPTLTLAAGISYVLNGLVVIRIYTRIFLGSSRLAANT